MRRLAIVVPVLVLAVVAGAAVVVLADTGGGRTPVSCMDTRWRTTPVSTSSTHWAPVSGFSSHPVAIFPLAINVSAQVSGAPVQFRILSTNVGEQTTVSKPGPTRFVPGANGPNSFAYQWVERDGSTTPHGTFVRLQWRSPGGGDVHLQRGDMSILYATDGCTGST
jgi:hypothetical protein